MNFAINYSTQAAALLLDVSHARIAAQAPRLYIMIGSLGFPVVDRQCEFGGQKPPNPHP